MALLTGQLAEERPLGRIDLAPLLWKDFAAAGYRTLFVEDAFVGNQIFNIDMEASNRPGGFVSVPTDYYFRPLGVAMHVDHSLIDWRGKMVRLCTGPILEDELVLNWVSKYHLYITLHRFTSDTTHATYSTQRTPLYPCTFRPLRRLRLLRPLRLLRTFSPALHALRWMETRRNAHSTACC